MDRIQSYVLTGTIGVGSSTIASAIVGDPFPVVVPAAVAGLGIAAHHVRERDREATDDDVRDAIGGVDAVETDGGRP